MNRDMSPPNMPNVSQNEIQSMYAVKDNSMKKNELNISNVSNSNENQNIKPIDSPYSHIVITDWIPKKRPPRTNNLTHLRQSNVPSRYIKTYNYFNSEDIHKVFIAIYYKFKYKSKKIQINDEITNKIYVGLNHTQNSISVHTNIMNDIQNKTRVIYSFVEKPLRILYSNSTNPFFKYTKRKQLYYLKRVVGFYKNKSSNVEYTIELDEILSIVYDFFIMYIHHPLFIQIMNMG